MEFLSNVKTKGQYVLILVLILCFSNGIAVSQGFGIKGAFTMPSLSDDDGDYYFKLGGSVGILYQIKVSETFKIQPEVIYTGQGANIYDEEDWYQLNYINVPLMFQAGVTENMFLEFGPQAGFLISGQKKNFYDSSDITERINEKDYSVAIGGYTGFSGLQFGLRYNIGLSDTYIDNSEKVTNNVLMIYMDFVF